MADDVKVTVCVASPTRFWRAEGAELGAAIRARRKALRLSIEVLAVQAGMHPTYLSAIERGRSNPTWDRVSDVAEVLDVPVSVLAREAEDRRIERAIHSAARTAYRTARNRDDVLADE